VQLLQRVVCVLAAGNRRLRELRPAGDRLVGRRFAAPHDPPDLEDLPLLARAGRARPAFGLLQEQPGRVDGGDCVGDLDAHPLVARLTTAERLFLGLEGVLDRPPDQVRLIGRDLRQPAKKSDARSKRWVGATCQLEALAPDELAGIVTEEIESLLRESAFNRQVEIEQDERETILRALPSGDA